MVRRQSLKLTLDGYGSYLGMGKGCYLIRDKKGDTERYPVFDVDIKEVILRTGNTVSTGALASLGFWEENVLILTGRGRPVAYLRATTDDSHVKTRICQYEALNDERGIIIAKSVILSRFEGQNMILDKYDLMPHNIDILERLNNVSGKLDSIRSTLNGIEGKMSKYYFDNILTLIPKKIRPERRNGFNAYDGFNNALNYGYEILRWKIHKAIITAKLEPYLGFLHSLQYSKPSLILDVQELYRHFIEDFIIQYIQNIEPKDFIMKEKPVSSKRIAKRQFLTKARSTELLKGLNKQFEKTTEIPRIKHGKKQTIDTLINEEVLLLASFIRKDLNEWVPRPLYL